MIDTTGKSLNKVCEEIFKALVDQGEQCLDKDGNCAYGNDKGHHCVIGFLLPENNPELMKFVGDLSNLIDLGDLGSNTDFIQSNLEALYTMQEMHDYKARSCDRDRLQSEFNISNKYIDQWVEMGTTG